MNEIISRREWGAPNRPLSIDRTPLDNQVIFHTEAGAIRGRQSYNEDVAHMRAIDSFHANQRGWPGGVGYQFVIMESGRIFEGRGWDWMGGHTKGLNTELGICFAGHGDQARETPAQEAAAKWLIAEAIRLGRLRSDYTVSGHRDHIPPGTKSCPGKLIYPHLHIYAGISAGTPTQEDDDMGYAAWNDEDKQKFWQDFRLLGAPVITGARVDDVNDAQTNLGDVINGLHDVGNQVTASEVSIRAGTLQAIVNAMHQVVGVVVQVGVALGVDRTKLRLPRQT